MFETLISSMEEDIQKGQYNNADMVDHKGVAGIILKDNKIVILKHNKLGKWTIPVGKVDTGSTFEEAIKQELNEELGIVVNHMIDIKTFDAVYERPGTSVNVTSKIFLILDYDNRVRNNEPNKHKDLKWITLDQLMNYNKKELTDSTVKFLDTLIN